MSRYLAFLSSRNFYHFTAATSLSFCTLYDYKNSTHCDGSRPEKRVFTWGSGAVGQLGHGNNKDISIPTMITNFPEHFRPEMVIAGGDSSAVVSTTGEVYTFGSGGHSRLGHGDAYDLPNISVPQMIYTLQGKNIVSVSIGEYHMAALSEDGRIWTWGRDRTPQLGHDNKLRGHPNEVIELAGKVRDIQCGRQHTVALTKDGKVYTWGIGRQGALGHCNREDVNRPRMVEKLADKKIIAINCGREFTLALDNNGTLYCWGANDYGQLGVVTISRYQHEPIVNHSFPEDSKLVAISAGSFHSVALAQSGKVYTWGKGKDGQLGLGNNEDLSSPRKIEALDHVRIKSISSGDGHTVCIDEQGQMWLFGRGRSGQLGRGNKLESIAAYRNLPTNLMLRENYQTEQTSCGYDHTIALGSKK